MSAYPPPAPPATARPSVVPTVLGSIGVALLGILLLLVLAYVVLGLGVSAAGICAVIALVPLTVVLLGVRWVDRWEPEPALGLWFAFLWGAAGSVAIALLVDLGVQIAVYASGQQPSGSDFVGAVIQAPLVEETAKGIGVLLVLLIWRRTFDGPVDGIVYAAVVASGFAFVENILYFGSALVEGGLGSLAVTFFLRGVLSPFAHVLFTACTGAALASPRTGPPSRGCPSPCSGWRSPRSCTRSGTARRSWCPTGSASTAWSRCRCSRSPWSWWCCCAGRSGA